MSGKIITLAGRYRYEEDTDVIGRGGFATVVKARDLRLGREVALKLLDPLIVQREPAFAQYFAREAGEVSRLSHVNIVHIYDFGVEGSQLYLVMEHLPGGDLLRRLKEHGPFSLEEALAVVEPIAAALDSAHTAGLIHRDVKPQNILLTADGRPVLTDFGLSKLIGSSQTASMKMMSSGGLLGTAEYMAPEQAWGKPVGPATDIYALAVTLFQLLTGEVPFHGDTPLSTVFQVTSTPRESLNERLPAGLSREARATLLAGMAIDANARPQSGATFIAGLRAAISKPVAPAPPPTVQEPRREPPKRSSSAAPDIKFPDIEWGGEVPAGKYTIGGDSRALRSFPAQTVSIAGPYRLAKYPVTNAQFDCFINAPDVDDPRWWQGMPKNEKYKKNVSTPRWSGPNRPREWVTWYQAIAFCRWLDNHLKAAGVISAGEEIYLPHEYEWEVAARYAGNGRVDGRIYPWGDEITPQHANYDETGLKETSDEGRFPAGRQPVLDLYDMSGNVWEWCRNKYGQPEDTRTDESGDLRALRGGSWNLFRRSVHAASRDGFAPFRSFNFLGFRAALLAGMAIDANARPQSGATFIAGLWAAISKPVAPARSPTVQETRREPLQRPLSHAGIRLPDIEWGGEVPPGSYQISFDKPVRIASPYRLAKYPVTNAQFDCFLNAPDVDDPRWWQGMPESEKYKAKIREPRWSGSNRPRESVTWYQAFAFCRWLDNHLKAVGAISAGEEVDLPHEYEWEVAACYAGNGRVDKRIYPWGDKITPNHANYDETGLKETSDVGRFPAGRQPVLDLYDMSGNVWEWCRNKYDKPEDTRVDESGNSRALRGGSWFDFRGLARAASRWGNPGNRNADDGFRVAVRRPPSQHGH